MTETVRPIDWQATPTELPPLPTVREQDGRLVVDWPDPRPSWVAVDPSLIDGIVERVNRLEDELDKADALMHDMGDEQAAGVAPCEHVVIVAGDRCHRCGDLVDDVDDRGPWDGR